MRTFQFIICFGVALVLTSCHKKDDCAFGPLTEIIQVGKKYCIGSSEYLEITKIEDSRCPEMVECFWEGNTVLYIDLYAHHTLHDAILEVSNTDQPVLFKDIFGYDITIRSIQPYPKGQEVIPQSAYRIGISVVEK